MIAEAIGHTIQAQMLPPSMEMECECNTPLTEEEKDLAKIFDIPNI